MEKIMTEKEKIFNETAKKAAKDKGYDLKKINYYSYHMCPDQYICRIEDISNDYFNLTKRKNIFTENTFDIINIPDAENILVTILESSHISEHFEQLSKYKHGDIRKNSVPAIGKYSGDTGSNIVKSSIKSFNINIKSSLTKKTSCLPSKILISITKENILITIDK